MRLIVAAVATGFLATMPAFGQDDEKKKAVTFETTDEVRLTGTFYRGNKGSESPAVLMIPAFNSDRTKGGWDSLATELQNRGFAVLTFDFRGHGGSTSVRERFWGFEQNKGGIRGGTAPKNKVTISASDFKSGYWPVLLNDIAAARHFIDLQNDAQRCNSGSIIVIGAQEGASLAVAWMAQEWERRVVPAGTPIYSVGTTSRNLGEDLACAVLIGPVERSSATGTGFRIREWIGRAPQLRENTPFYVLYGKQDPNAAQVVPAFMAAVRRPPENVRNKHSVDKEEGLNTKLPGQDLVGNAALQVNDKIAKYVEEVMAKHRKNVAWREMRPQQPVLFPLGIYGYPMPR
jgi:pimeloyl-ACP methyl ester carboxylesterase